LPTVKPAAFEYHAPTTLAEATGLLARHGDEAKVLAGGQSLVPMLALRLTSFPHLVDLGRVDELRGVEAGKGSVTVRAMTTQSAALRDPGLAGAPLLGLALPHIGHFQIRNRGTVGGSIAHADPASELPAVALALDAELEVAGPKGSRRVPATDFFQGTWTTSLGEDEILAAVHFPTWSGASGFAVEELARRHGDFAIAGAAVGVQVTGGRISRAAVALFGMDSTPIRAAAAEAALNGQPVDALDLSAVGQAATSGMSPPADIHATSVYRVKVGAVLVQRALERAIKEAGNG
jgi:carbon-monoxide dehydrogenase medium subunit